MAKQLVEFLREGTTKPFVWGSCDCCLWVADWFKINRGFDPVPHMRGSYYTAIGCAMIIKSSGGLLKMLENLGLHLPEISEKELKAGDIVALDVPPNGVLSIWTGKRFAAKAPTGLTFLHPKEAKILQAWRL